MGIQVCDWEVSQILFYRHKKLRFLESIKKNNFYFNILGKLSIIRCYIPGWECAAAQGTAIGPAAAAGGGEKALEQQAGEDRTVCTGRTRQEYGRIYTTGRK